MKIHERIFKLRRAAGLSQETLAERVGVSRQAIGKWENGAALPGLDNLQALAAALGVSCDELLTGGTQKETREDAAGEELTNAGVRALLDAYQAAQRQAARRQRMLLASLAAVLLALACLGAAADVRLRALAGRVDDVSGRMDGIDRRIDERVGSIRAEIEESLNESERIVADFDWQYRMLPEDRVELTLTATPKSRRDSTSAAFSVVPPGGGTITAEAAPREDGIFTAQMEIPLTLEYESFAVMAAFTTQGETQSQLLFREYSFYSSRRIVASITLTDFRAEVLSPGTEQARLSLGGECGLEIQSPDSGNAPVPVSAEVALLADGKRLAVRPIDLSDAFGAPGSLSGDEANMQAGEVTNAAQAVGITCYVRFEPQEIPLPRTGAVLQATVTDSSGQTTVCRQEVYRS